MRKRRAQSSFAKNAGGRQSPISIRVTVQTRDWQYMRAAVRLWPCVLFLRSARTRGSSLTSGSHLQWQQSARVTICTQFGPCSLEDRQLITAYEARGLNEPTILLIHV